MINDSLQQRLNDQPNMQQIMMIDAVFYQAFKHFHFLLKSTYYYTLFKCIFTPLIIILSQLPTNLQIWFIGLSIVSIFQYIHYKRIERSANNIDKILQIGQQLNHVRIFAMNVTSKNLSNIQDRLHDTLDFQDFEQDQFFTTGGKIRLLALQIKYFIQINDDKIYWWGKISFIAYQIIHIWGFIIFFQITQQSLVDTYLMLILILGTYQYLDFYIILVMIITILPFYTIGRAITLLMEKRRKNLLLNLLKEIPYNQQLKGDHQCKICMATYENTDKITILKCNDMHHFHSQCIKSWLKVSLSCPLCRKQVV